MSTFPPTWASLAGGGGEVVVTIEDPQPQVRGPTPLLRSLGHPNPGGWTAL